MALADASMNQYRPVSKPETWIYEHDIPGETQAHRVLEDFVMQTGWAYSFSLSSPSRSVTGSSRLSSYITYGNLSQRQVYQRFMARASQLRQYRHTDLSSDKKQRLTQRNRSLRACISRIHWRCHFVQKLESRPQIEYANQNI